MTVLSPTETDNQLHGTDPQVRCYSSHFEDSMQMLAPQAVVARYPVSYTHLTLPTICSV